jgi:hypothetical protein
MLPELFPIGRFSVPPHITAVWHKEYAGKEKKDKLYIPTTLLKFSI